MADSKYESSLLSQDHIDNLLEEAMKEDTAEDTDSVLQDNSDSGLITEDEINKSNLGNHTRPIIKQMVKKNWN